MLEVGGWKLERPWHFNSSSNFLPLTFDFQFYTTPNSLPTLANAAKP